MDLVGARSLLVIHPNVLIGVRKTVGKLLLMGSSLGDGMSVALTRSINTLYKVE